MVYENEEQILNDFEEGKINKYQKYVALGRLGKNSKYFTDDDLMCMYCDDLYTCDNMGWYEERLPECRAEREKGNRKNI